ncbi:glycosyltransferase [Streptococcus lutetiensis]|uniref:glycosyltransferase n=1 Tax=Streptococcus lutetiensis TaxID=150055 RepID=UPI0019643482|nr:glycosyltransferase [Streptococcus lutetiensis]
MEKIAAGIVLYNPEDTDRLDACVKSILKQVNKLYIYDNSTNQLSYSFPEGVRYNSCGENKGIAFALNELMKLAASDGFEWLITMDQDSVMPDNVVESYSKAIEEAGDNLGIVCPQVIDKRRKYMQIADLEGSEYVNECITSASCTSIKAWKKIGGFDDWLFIDLVDNEFCKRLIVSGYKILRLNHLVLDQEFGSIQPKGKFSQKFWISLSKMLKNENIAKFSYKKNVSPMRVYYTCRNIIYVNRKLKRYGKTAYSNYNCEGYFGFIISFVLPSFLRAKDKFKVLKAIVKGTNEGLAKKVISWQP